jgi:hypothetical protein
VPRCPNCAAELSGEYCSVCGQRRIHAEDLSARRFLRELADELAEFRARFKTLNSLRALFSPGFLTNEHLAGRRQAYLTPLKLYFVCAAIFFLVSPFAGFSLTSLRDDDRSGNVARRVSARMAERGLDEALFAQRFDRRLQTVYTLSAGIGVIGSALALQLLYRRRGLPFGAQLIFALHYVSFQYLLTLAAGASRRLGASTELASALGIGLIAAYLVLAVGRVYPGTAASTLVKAGVLLLVTLAVNYVVSTAAILLTIRLV